jgi:hypothetical protein
MTDETVTRIEVPCAALAGLAGSNGWVAEGRRRPLPHATKENDHPDRIEYLVGTDASLARHRSGNCTEAYLGISLFTSDGIFVLGVPKANRKE